MNLRSYASFFPANKSLWDLVVDTFNFIYERSPLTLASLTGYHHPRVPRLTGNLLLGRAPEVTGSPDGLANLYEQLAELAVDDQNNPRGISYCSLASVPCMLVTKPTDIAQILLHNDDKIFRGIPALSEVFGHETLFSIPSGKAWREKRNKLRGWILNPDALADLVPEMQMIVDEFSEQLRANGDVKSLEEFLIALTMNVFARTRMGSGPLGNATHPIGAGNRDCPGRMFALQEAKLVLIAFVQNFDFSSSLDDKLLETYIRGTLKVKEDVHAVFTPRLN